MAKILRLKILVVLPDYSFRYSSVKLFLNCLSRLPQYIMYSVEKGKKNKDFSCNFVCRAEYVNFALLLGHQRKLRK